MSTAGLFDTSLNNDLADNQFNSSLGATASIINRYRTERKSSTTKVILKLKKQEFV